MPRPLTALRKGTARRVRARTQEGASPAGVLSADDVEFLGGFKMPQSLNAFPANGHGVGFLSTAFTYAPVTHRVVGSSVRLLACGNRLGGGLVYEVEVPATLGSGNDVNAWPAASLLNAWGNVYDDYQGHTTNVVSCPAADQAVLSECSHWEDDHFVGMFIDLYAGTGSPQTRTVTDYVGSTRTATVNSNWTTNPDATTAYRLYHGTAQGGTTSTITLAASSSSVTDFYKYLYVYVVAGTGAGQLGMVTAYNGTTKAATCYWEFASPQNEPFATPPDATSKYRLVRMARWMYNEGAWQGHISGGNAVYGLHWDEADQRLYWAYGGLYVNAIYNPSMGYSKLDDTTKAARPFGPWRLSGTSDKWQRGGVVPIPAAWASANVSGRRLGWGLGGMNLSQIAGASYGPALAAVDPPGDSQNLPADSGDTAAAFPALTGTRLLGHPEPGNQPSPPPPGRRNDDYVLRDPYDAPWAGTVATAENRGHSGTAQGGSATTVVLANSANAADDYYLGAVVEITSGPGSPALQQIIDYEGATRTATVWPNYDTPPTSSSQYQLRLGRLTMQDGGDYPSAEWKEDWGYSGHTLTMTSGAANGQVMHSSYNARTGSVLHLQDDWPVLPSAGDTFQMNGSLAGAGSTPTTLVLKDEHYGTYPGDGTYFVRILSGPGSADGERTITGQSLRTLTVSPAWSTTPVAGSSRYLIYGKGFPDPTNWDASGGVGYMVETDSVNGCVWAEYGGKHAVIFTCLLSHGFTHYEASDIHSRDGRKVWWHFYDPDDLAAVASGDLEQYEPVPASMSIDPAMDDGSPLGFSYDHKPGCTYDAANNRLYVYVADAYYDGLEPFPVVYVYRFV